MLTRRDLLKGTSLGAAGFATGVAAKPRHAMRLPALIDDLQERTFRFFWETTNPANGLAPDRWPAKSFSSIAAVGFALSAYPIGVERGWIGRAAARERTLATLRFLWHAPQGPAPVGMTGHKGFFYHFLDMETGARFEQTELSTIDTALLLAGALFAAGYFDRPDEAEIGMLARQIYARVDWAWASPNAPLVTLGWGPESGFIAYDWRGYNEAMLLYVLALGSPTHPVPAAAWAAWAATYPEFHGTHEGIELLGFDPLFGHQYPATWIDFRGIRDAPMRAAGHDYFENGRRATLVQQRYAIRNPMGWTGYGENVWGLTACDGPLDAVLPINGQPRTFRTYTARGVGGPHPFDDGTIAPTAALGSIAFAPGPAMAAAAEMRRRYGTHIYGKYGFIDAFNPSLDRDITVHHGRIVPGFGWVDTDYLGIDQGPIVTGIENYRTGLIWSVMRRSPAIRTGLRRAGFTGGWLAA